MCRSQHRTSLVWVVLLTVVGFVTAGLGTVHARQAQEQETVTSADVSEEELEQFTRSFNDVLEIEQELQGTLASVQDPEQALQLQQQADAEMVEAVDEHGMEVERFSQISLSLSGDAQLSQRFQAMRKTLELEEEGQEQP